MPTKRQLIESSITKIVRKIIMEDLSTSEKTAMARLKTYMLKSNKEKQFRELEKASAKNPELPSVYEFFVDSLQKANLYGQISFGTNELIIEPKTPPSGEYDGMQIIYTLNDKEFEVSEFQAGPNQDQLWVYTITKSKVNALKSLLKGNKNRKPIKVWD